MILQQRRAGSKDQQAAGNGDIPAKAGGEPGVGQRVSHERESAAQHTKGGIGGKRRIMAEGDKEDDRSGCERHAHDPAADGGTPLASCQTRRADNDGGEDQLKHKNVHQLHIQ